jgi:hypothetical protein
MRPKRLTWLRTIAASLAFLTMLVASGCGAKVSKVKGKVTQGSKPVVWGSVALVDNTGMYHQGAINLDGTYEIDKVPSGKVKIGVFSPSPEGARKERGGGGLGSRSGARGGGEPDPNDPRAKFKSEPPPEPPKPPPGTWFPISDKYTDPNSSGLSGEVQPGKDLNIDLPK